MSKEVQKWLNEKHVSNYTTKSKVKAPQVERAIRTIRSAMQRHFVARKTRRWLEWLPQWVSTYNNRIHSTTKLRPLDIVMDPFLHVDNNDQPRRKETKLPAIGSFVRISRLRGVFEKESTGTWTPEVFRVSGWKTDEVIPMITVEDLMGEPILGALYPEEWQQVEFDPKTKEIDQIIKKRARKGQAPQVLATFQGWPSKHRAWVDQ